MSRIYSFPPVVGACPKVLILGSMPSERSLQKRRYYGNERNHFWYLMGRVLNSETPLDYESRLCWLMCSGIAVWDSAASCERKGSLDKDIACVEPNDVNGLLSSHETIRAVFFNGVTAEKMYRKFNSPVEKVNYVLLPSSSPVPRRDIRTAEDKLPYWLKIREFLGGNKKI